MKKHVAGDRSVCTKTVAIYAATRTNCAAEKRKEDWNFASTLSETSLPTMFWMVETAYGELKEGKTTKGIFPKRTVDFTGPSILRGQCIQEGERLYLLKLSSLNDGRRQLGSSFWTKPNSGWSEFLSQAGKTWWSGTKAGGTGTHLVSCRRWQKFNMRGCSSFRWINNVARLFLFWKGSYGGSQRLFKAWILSQPAV